MILFRSHCPQRQISATDVTICQTFQCSNCQNSWRRQLSPSVRDKCQAVTKAGATRKHFLTAVDGVMTTCAVRTTNRICTILAFPVHRASCRERRITKCHCQIAADGKSYSIFPRGLRRSRQSHLTRHQQCTHMWSRRLYTQGLESFTLRRCVFDVVVS